MKVSDLPDWPPSVFGIVGPPSTVPTHPDKVTIKSVGLATNERVEAVGTFQGRDVRFNVQVPDKITGEKVAAILRDNIGQILLSVGAPRYTQLVISKNPRLAVRVGEPARYLNTDMGVSELARPSNTQTSESDS